eukprot:PhM_4_TR5350/c0_g1_i1/m.88453
MQWTDVLGTTLSSLSIALTNMKSHRYAPLQKVRFLPLQYKKHHDSVADAVVGWLSDVTNVTSRCETWEEARDVLMTLRSGTSEATGPHVPTTTTETSVIRMTTQLHEQISDLTRSVAVALKVPKQKVACTAYPLPPRTLFDVPGALTCTSHHVAHLKELVERLEMGSTLQANAAASRKLPRTRPEYVWRCVVLRRRMRRFQRTLDTQQLVTRRFIEKEMERNYNELQHCLSIRANWAKTTPWERQQQQQQHHHPAMEHGDPTPRGVSSSRRVAGVPPAVNMNEQFAQLRQSGGGARTPNPTSSTSINVDVRVRPRTPPMGARHVRSVRVKFSDPMNNNTNNNNSTGEVGPSEKRPLFVRSVLQHLPQYRDHSSSLRKKFSGPAAAAAAAATAAPAETQQPAAAQSSQSPPPPPPPQVRPSTPQQRQHRQPQQHTTVRRTTPTM